VTEPRTERSRPEIDYASPEGEQAVRETLDLMIEVRRDLYGPLARRVRVYERTLGLAVVPMLARRLLGRARRRLGQARRSRS
jgi:hypothetical protein